MKTKNLLLSGILGLALSGFVLTGCHKSATTTTDTDYTAAQDEANGSFASTDAKNVSDAALQNNGSNYGPERNINRIYSSHCTVTWNDTSTSTMDTMYINFGATPVQCNDYRWRKGEIIVYWAKKTGFWVWQSYFDSGSTVAQTFRGYAVGSASNAMNGVAGTRTWTNKGYVSGYMNWDFSAYLTITYPDGKTATWNSVRYNVLKNISGTWYYQIKGSAYGTSRNGVGYTLSIEDANPLYVTAWPWWLGGCAWIESGIVDINRTTSTNTLSINFGSIGTCDNIAVATINGNNYTFYMW